MARSESTSFKIGFMLKFFQILALVATFISFAHSNANAWFNKNNVGYDSEIILADDDLKYLEIDIWFPTSKEANLRSVQREDKLFLYATNAQAIEEELDLIIISPPPFAESLDYAGLSHTLAKKGYLVVTITHTGDNKLQMQSTMTAKQFYSRAEQIALLLDYMANNADYIINKDTISLISFTETALAPLLIQGYNLNTHQYDSYCLQSLASSSNLKRTNKKRKDAALYSAKKSFCSDEYAEQIETIIHQIPYESKNYREKSAQFKIANYFLVEPVLSFLFEAKSNSNISKNHNLYAFYTEEEYFSSNDVQSDYLSALHRSVEKIDLEIPNYMAISDSCPPSESPIMNDICYNTSSSKRNSYINKFIDKIEQILEEKKN